MLILQIVLVLTFYLICFFLLHAILKKKMQYWIYSEIKRGVLRIFKPKPKGPIHIMFAFVDHFEPGNRNADPEQQKARVEAWVQEYPILASKHKDSDGICPQHTFFFPPHYDTHDHLERIVELCSRGFGEVEMHLHHDRQEPWPDNEASLKKKILDCIEEYSRYGVFCLPDGRKKYAFIHGDWALANSLRGGQHCGVNDELSILEGTGCYADFTFPVSNEAQPKMANTIFYGTSCRSHSKGYNSHPIPVKAGFKSSNGLLFVQGVIGLRWKSRTHKLKPSIEQSNIDIRDQPIPGRIDYWVKKAIHVKRKPEWVFVKIHTHGSREEDRELLLGNGCKEMYSYLETKYNDSEKYFLHYVSAREMYNIIKAAEDGLSGPPGRYRNYIVPKYIYLPRRNEK